MSGAFGGGKSSSTQNPATVWSGQAPYLKNLYQGSQDAGQNLAGQQYAQGFQNPAMQAFMQQAGGGAQTDISGLQGIAQGGGQFAQMQDENLYGAIQAGLGDINRNFQQNIMPGINTGASQAGTSGGSRQGIAQGLAAQGANRQAGDFVNQMRSQNFNQQMNRNIAQEQNQLGAYGQMGQFNQMQNQAQQGAMGLAPQVSNLGFASQFGNLQNQAQILGRPTVLGGGGQSDSWNLSTSGGLW